MLIKNFSAIAVLVTGLLFSSPSFAQEENGEYDKSIVVMATSSLTEVMTELIRVYTHSNNITVNVTYGSPSDLERRISEGENADVFIAEQTKWMNNLKQKGLIDVYSISNMVKNGLVLAASAQSKIAKDTKDMVPIKDMLKGINERTILVIVDPENDPLGVYSKSSLENLGYWDKIKTMMLRAANSVNAVYLISRGESVGITYYSDAFLNPELKVISNFPDELHDQIVYQSAVVAGENMQSAREFLDFLKTDRAKKIFEKYGFITI